MSVPLAMVAGEASGDLLAGLLLSGLNQSVPDLQTYGIGGARMVAQGFRADWPMEKLAVSGYNLEVLLRYREILSIRNRLKARLLAEPPAAFVGVDAPDFNLDLEIALRQKNIPTIHFVGPSIWAWRGERIRKIAAAVDHMLLLFPFEEEIYRKAGIAASYVGHPLADVIPLEPDRSAARAQLGLTANAEVLAVMPGSRMAEIRHIAPVFIAAARRLHQLEPEVQMVVPMVGQETRAYFESWVKRLNAEVVPFKIVEGQSHAVLAASNAVLVASGTATLEAALFKRPMVIAYRMGRISWLLMRNKGYLPWVGLPNILAREFLVPEFLQDATTPEALCNAVLFQLRDAANRARLEQRFAEIHHTLRRNTAQQAAEVVTTILKR
jgi:lipid-A-disaccharide synthase